MCSGDESMHISPTENKLVVAVRIDPVDKGQLELGRSVDIYLDAFDSTIYRKLEGLLIYLIYDILTESAKDGASFTYYRARSGFSPAADDVDWIFTGLELKPGITATVGIGTAKRTVLQFIAKPILRAFSGVMTQL